MSVLKRGISLEKMMDKSFQPEMCRRAAHPPLCDLPTAEATTMYKYAVKRWERERRAL